MADLINPSQSLFFSECWSLKEPLESTRRIGGWSSISSPCQNRATIDDELKVGEESLIGDRLHNKRALKEDQMQTLVQFAAYKGALSRYDGWYDSKDRLELM